MAHLKQASAVEGDTNRLLRGLFRDRSGSSAGEDGAHCAGSKEWRRGLCVSVQPALRTSAPCVCVLRSSYGGCPLWTAPFVLSCWCLQSLPGWGALWELPEPRAALPVPSQEPSRAAGGPRPAQPGGEPCSQPTGPMGLLLGCAVLCLSFWTLIARIS